MGEQKQSFGKNGDWGWDPTSPKNILCAHASNPKRKKSEQNQLQQICIITEAYEGIPIFEWILHMPVYNSNRQLTENTVALVMREIFKTLESVQKDDLKLIHRDLRAENILVKDKLVGQNVYCDDEDYCPFAI